MSANPFIGQIIMFGGNFAPRDWALCNGQLLSIASNTALFSILGTTFGGDGRTTFALPDLRGRVPVHSGSSTGPGLSPRPLGQKAGSETVTLTADQIPPHSHQLRANSGRADSTDPSNATIAKANEDTYNSGNSDVMMKGNTANTGGGQAHNNMQPYQCVNFIIALVGVYPSRS